MIELHRLNGDTFFVNPDLIRTIEVTPDTLLCFTDGEKILVSDKADRVVTEIINFRKKLKEVEVLELK